MCPSLEGEAQGAGSGLGEASVSPGALFLRALLEGGCGALGAPVCEPSAPSIPRVSRFSRPPRPAGIPPARPVTVSGPGGLRPAPPAPSATHEPQCAVPG